MRALLRVFLPKNGLRGASGFLLKHTPTFVTYSHGQKFPEFKAFLRFRSLSFQLPDARAGAPSLAGRKIAK